MHFEFRHHVQTDTLLEYMGSLLHILKTNILMLSNAKLLLWLTYFNIIYLVETRLSSTQ